jgi:hypothetical protein
LFKWEMDKRYMPEENDRCVINVIGTMSGRRHGVSGEIIQENSDVEQKGGSE